MTENVNTYICDRYTNGNISYKWQKKGDVCTNNTHRQL